MSMSPPRVFIPDPIHADGVMRLSERCEVFASDAMWDEAAKRAAFARADAVIVRNLRIDAKLMESCPRLRVISKHGAGVDNIDIPAATALGIVVANVPGGNAAAVAEGTVALMLAVLRQVPYVHGLVTSGDYAARWRLQFGQLSGRTLGVVGIGNIGERVARICADGFKMRVLAYDPALSATEVRKRGAEKVDDLRDLLAAADVVTLHSPMAKDNFHLIDAGALESMKPTAILVNAARGALIDERALAEALNEGRIGGAGLDVFEIEPPAPDNPILRARNVVLSPHTTGNTVEATRLLAVASADIILRVLDGVRPEGFLNPNVWETRRAFD
jgi:D-3-phosphoglycerate dehydrogenase / 2-oxoglutarate reductase